MDLEEMLESLILENSIITKNLNLPKKIPKKKCLMTIVHLKMIIKIYLIKSKSNKTIILIMLNKK